MRISRSTWSYLHLALTSLVLLVYGSTGVFRYGLHTVLDCEHCTAESCCTNGKTAAEKESCQGCSCCHVCPVSPEPSSHACTGHGHDTPQAPAEKLAAAEGYCPICAFLTQAQTQAVEPTDFLQVTYVAGQPVPSETLAPEVFLYKPHARGPPTV